MTERTPYPDRGGAAAPTAAPQEESLYAEMLRYQNENNIEDERDLLSVKSPRSPKSRRRKKEGRSRSPNRSSDGTPSSRGERKETSRSTPSSGRRRNHTSSGRSRSPMNVPLSPSSDKKKPGIVSVDQPAIHPNSTMYHAAYNNPTPALAPAPIITNNAGLAEATAISLSGSGPVSSSSNLTDPRSRSPKRSDAPHGARPHRGKSPRKDPLGAAPSTHNPATRPLVSPMSPQSGAQHNPMFFASVDDRREGVMGTNQMSKKPKSKTPMLDALGLSQHKKTKSKPQPSNSTDNAPLDLDAPNTSKKQSSNMLDPLGITGALGLSQGKKSKNKPQRSRSTDSTDNDLDAPNTSKMQLSNMLDPLGLSGALGLSQQKKSKSKPQRSRSTDSTDNDLDAPNTSKMQLSNMLDPLGLSGALGLSQGKKSKSKPQRSRSTDSTENDLDAPNTDKKSKSRSKSPKLLGGVRRRRNNSLPDDATPPKINQKPRRGSTFVDEMPSIAREDVEMSTPDMPVFSQPNRRRGSVGAASNPSQAHNRRTKSPPPMSGWIRNTSQKPKKKSPPRDRLARPDTAGRAATTGTTNLAPTSSSSLPNQTPDPQQMERSSSFQTPIRAGRRTSTPQDQMDADLILALQLSQQDAQASQPRAASPQSSSPTPRLPSPKPPPSAARASPSPRSSPAAAAAKKKNVGLGDHFARSDVATDASTRGSAAEDEGSLADMLLALKISAEEEAARNGGESVADGGGGGGRTSYNAQRMTSIQELLKLEASDRRRNGASSDDDDDQHFGVEEEEEAPSVMDLVAAGVSAQSGDSSNGNRGTSARQQEDEYERMRQEEQRQLEMALKASEEAIKSSHPESQVDEDLRLALKASRDELDIANDEEFMREQQRAMEQFAAQQKKKKAPLDHERGRNSLMQRGTAETQRAIASGQAHIVTCRGCGAKLRAPIAYSLVFCPNCQTVSPTGM